MRAGQRYRCGAAVAACATQLACVGGGSGLWPKRGQEIVAVVMRRSLAPHLPGVGGLHWFVHQQEQDNVT